MSWWSTVLKRPSKSDCHLIWGSELIFKTAHNGRCHQPCRNKCHGPESQWPVSIASRHGEFDRISGILGQAHGNERCVQSWIQASKAEEKGQGSSGIDFQERNQVGCLDYLDKPDIVSITYTALDYMAPLDCSGMAHVWLLSYCSWKSVINSQLCCMLCAIQQLVHESYGSSLQCCALRVWVAPSSFVI